MMQIFRFKSFFNKNGLIGLTGISARALLILSAGISATALATPDKTPIINACETVFPTKRIEAVQSQKNSSDSSTSSNKNLALKNGIEAKNLWELEKENVYTSPDARYVTVVGEREIKIFSMKETAIFSKDFPYVNARSMSWSPNSGVVAFEAGNKIVLFDLATETLTEIDIKSHIKPEENLTMSYTKINWNQGSNALVANTDKGTKLLIVKNENKFEVKKVYEDVGTWKWNPKEPHLAAITKHNNSNVFILDPFSDRESQIDLNKMLKKEKKENQRDLEPQTTAVAKLDSLPLDAFKQLPPNMGANSIKVVPQPKQNPLTKFVETVRNFRTENPPEIESWSPDGESLVLRQWTGNEEELQIPASNDVGDFDHEPGLAPIKANYKTLGLSRELRMSIVNVKEKELKQVFQFKVFQRNNEDRTFFNSRFKLVWFNNGKTALFGKSDAGIYPVVLDLETSAIRYLSQRLAMTNGTFNFVGSAGPITILSSFKDEHYLVNHSNGKITVGLIDSHSTIDNPRWFQFDIKDVFPESGSVNGPSRYNAFIGIKIYGRDGDSLIVGFAKPLGAENVYRIKGLPF
ncbi:MAG: hypothetical protein ACXVCY_18370 [Pseudobdellovibrionaceae bacterium]